MYWVINGCCDSVWPFRWMIAQSHRNHKVSHESQCWNVGIWEFPLHTQEIQNLIHLLVKAGCSKEHISTVITAILKSAGIMVKGSIRHQTVSSILMEGYVTSQIQLGFEMAEAETLMGSGDGKVGDIYFQHPYVSSLVSTKSGQIFILKDFFFQNFSVQIYTSFNWIWIFCYYMTYLWQPCQTDLSCQLISKLGTGQRYPMIYTPCEGHIMWPNVWTWNLESCSFLLQMLVEIVEKICTSTPWALAINWGKELIGT